jgi:hypothetical protein
VNIHYGTPQRLHKIITILKILKLKITNFKSKTERVLCILEGTHQYCYRCKGTAIVNIASTYVHTHVVALKLTVKWYFK